MLARVNVPGGQRATKINIPLPAQSGVLFYDGTEQSPTWNNYAANQLDISGTTAATEVGTYTAYFTPKGKYFWQDNSQATIPVTWSINLATDSDSLVNNTMRFGTDSFYFGGE